jgi:hypothetical protein
MPTLADIYSAIDSAKRKGSDFVRNPGASLQQMAGYGMDRANAARDQLYEATTEEGMNYGPKTKALAQKMAEAYNPIGMTTWHGSPHIFEKFDLSKLGTGEGAQAYGSGMYTAQSPVVAKEYANRLGANLLTIDGKSMDFANPTHIAAAMISDPMNAGLPAKSLASALKYDPKGLLPGGTQAPVQDVIKALESGKLPNFENTKGNLYKVDVPDTHIRRMLDWDAPIKEQPVVVRNLAKSLGIDMNDLGGDLLAKVGKDEAGRKVMQDAGIRGVKYLDEKSRFSPHEVSIAVKGKPYASNQFLTKEQAEKYAAEKKAEGFETAYKNVGTKNFVVFDPNHMTILERNAKPIND